MLSLTAAQIPCCVCGTMIYPNAANQCTTCLSQDFNLQDYIQRPASSTTGNISHSNNDKNNQIIIHQCRNCRRFQRTEKCWESADHESSQLMSICLKHIPALQHNHTSASSSTASSSSSALSATAPTGPLRLMDAQWIWTEPHCMRYKIRCTIQTEIHNVRVQQRVLILIHCAFKMCMDCTREFNHRTWQSVVQLRQKVSSEQQSSPGYTSTTSFKSKQQNGDKSRNGLMILEQALAKNKEIRKHVLKIDQVTNMGFDFYFISIPHAHTFVSFLQRIIPMRVRTSKKLVSTDAHSNIANMKHTMMCDMVPFNVNDLIVIHKSTTKCKLSGHLVVVTKLASVIHFMNAAPQRQRLVQPKNASFTSSMMIDDCTMELSAETYYKQGGEKQYRVLQSSHRLIRFVVLDVELLSCDNTDPSTYYQHNDNNDDENLSNSTTNTEQKQYAMADVLVARESDMGTNDRTFTTISHLGRHIEAGDIVLGYDLESSSLNLDDDDMNDNFYNNFIMPDVVLVKKAPMVLAAATNGKHSQSSSKSDKTNTHINKQMKKDKVKKQPQRRRQNDGKRTRELEERAKRMGFIPEESVENVYENEDNVDDDTNLHAEAKNNDDDYNDENSTSVRPHSNNVYDDDILYDTDIVNEVLALEREFETLDLQQQQQQQQQQNDDIHAKNDNADRSHEEQDEDTYNADHCDTNGSVHKPNPVVF